MLRNKLYVYGDEDVRVPATFNYGQYMLQKFISYKDNVALLNADTKKSKTYRELAQEIVDIALSLTHIGVRKGDVVVVSFERHILGYNAFSLFNAVTCTGAISLALSCDGSAIILYQLKIVKPKIMICSRDTFDRYKDVFRSVGSIEQYIIDGEDKVEGTMLYKEFLSQSGRIEDFISTPVDIANDVIKIVFSSGTTGMPKPIADKHYMALARLGTSVHVNLFNSSSLLGKAALATQPHIAFTRECLYAGALLIYTVSDKMETYLKLIDEYSVTIVQMAPMTVVELSKSALVDKCNLTSLQYIITGASPFRAEQYIATKKRLPTVKLCQLYGTTETWAVCRDETAPLGSKPGSVGPACAGVILKVVDVVTREALGPNQRGEICARSLAAFTGYLSKDIERSSYMDEEGFFMTGDLGYYDEDQYFYIVDRIKDTIKPNNSSTISPAFLEALLLQHPSVSEAGVVGAPHDKYGEVPVAFVVLQPGADVTEQELTDYVDRQIPQFMQIRSGLRFISKMPRGNLSKIDKQALKNLLHEEFKN